MGYRIGVDFGTTNKKRSLNMSKCPVCEKKLSEPIPPFCSTCSWDLKNDLSLGTFLGEIPDSVIEEYRQRLFIARKNWTKHQAADRKLLELEKKLKNFETRLSGFEYQKAERNEVEGLTQEFDEKLEFYVSRLVVLERREKEWQRKEWIEPFTGMVLIHVPAGKFMMGDIFEEGNDNEKPVHEVELDGFYIGKYPVTQVQWKKVMGNNPSKFKKGDDYPVENVSWHDTVGFIEKLKEMNAGRYEFHLPSEAQWEYAARSGGKKERYAGSDDPDSVAWYDGNSSDSTHPVGKKRPNGLGIYDMSGNIWERCLDIYDNDAYSKHEHDNPIYAGYNSDIYGGGTNRVERGGSWYDEPASVRCAYRNINSPGNRDYNLGFRLLKKP